MMVTPAAASFLKSVSTVDISSPLQPIVVRLPCHPYETEWTSGTLSSARRIVVQFLRSEQKSLFICS